MRAALILPLACLALAACAYEPPALDAADTWDDARSDAEASLPDGTWWAQFQSEELSQLVVTARGSNLSLKAAAARILEAEAGARIAGAMLYPSLNASAGASRNVRQVPDAPDLRTASYQGALSASYQLDVFGQLRNSSAAALQRLESSRHDRETVAISLTTSVITSYLQVLSARERLSLAGNRLANAEKILQLLESQRRIGTISELELAQQRSALASQRATLPALRLAAQQSLHALAVLLSQPPEGFDVKGQSLSDVTLPSVGAGISSLIMTRRPDVRSAESALKAAHFDVNAARAARFPSIALTASGGSASSALADVFSSGTLFYSLGASVAQTLFAGGRLAGQQQLAEGRYQELLENYRQAVLAAFRDVEDALSAVTQNGEQYGFAREASIQADEAYRLAELRYRTGAVDFQTVLNAQNAAFQAQEAVVQSGLSRFAAVISLTQALGGGWDGTLSPPL